MCRVKRLDIDGQLVAPILQLWEMVEPNMPLAGRLLTAMIGDLAGGNASGNDPIHLRIVGREQSVDQPRNINTSYFISAAEDMRGAEIPTIYKIGEHERF